MDGRKEGKKSGRGRTSFEFKSESTQAKEGRSDAQTAAAASFFSPQCAHAHAAALCSRPLMTSSASIQFHQLPLLFKTLPPSALTSLSPLYTSPASLPPHHPLPSLYISPHPTTNPPPSRSVESNLFKSLSVSNRRPRAAVSGIGAPVSQASSMAGEDAWLVSAVSAEQLSLTSMRGRR